MASANQTTATGSFLRILPRRNILSPSAVIGDGMGPMGPVKPLAGGPDYSRFNRPMGGSNAEGHTPGRGLSVGEIMSQREGRSNAYYGATGKPVAPGTILNASGWNTSGVGPGTHGYRGSYANGGYNYGAGTGRPSGQLGFGGLNDFYRNQQTAGQFDQLQGRAAMDRSDAIGSEMAQRQQIAAGRGDLDTAEAFAAALADRAGQRMAAQGSSFNQGPTTFGGVTSSGAPMTLPGSQAEINAFQPAGFLPEAQQPTADLDPNSWEVQAALDAAAERSRRPLQPGESATRGTRSGPASFTNAQGSMGPGGTMTSYGGRQAGPDFFQQAADRQGTRNTFASPTPGYGGVSDDSRNIDEYGRLMAVRNKLRK